MMKKLLTILAALISLTTYSQGVKISAMPTLTDPEQVAVSYFPVIYPVPPYTNYKALGSVVVAGVNTRIDSIVNNWPGLTRFGVSGEDDAAAQNRAFNLSDFIFNINTGVVSEEITFLKGAFSALVADGATPSNRTSIQLGASAGAATSVLKSEFSGGHEVSITSYADGSHSRLIFNLETDPEWFVTGLSTGTYDNVLYYDDVTGEIKWGAAPSGGGGSGSTVEARNGLLNINDSIIELGASTTTGAPLLHNTYVDGTASYTMEFLSSRTGSDGTLRGSNSSSGYGITGVSSSGNGVIGQSTTGTGIFATSSSSVGLQAHSGTGYAILADIEPSSTNTVAEVIRVRRTTSGTPANGIGGSINFRAATISNTDVESGSISVLWTDAVTASRTSDMRFKTYLSGTGTDRFGITGAGNVQLLSTGKGYGLKSPDGTVWYVTIDNAGVLSTSTTAP